MDADKDIDVSQFAFLYFAISVLIVLLIPLTWAVVLTPLFSFRPNPKYRNAPPSMAHAVQLDIRRSRFYRKRSYYFKLLTWLLLLMVFYNAYEQLPDPQLMRGFDPYEVLGVTSLTPVADIKKAYRQLAREYHPDKHPDEQDLYNKKFDKLSKAYECLTNPKKIPNCKRYGNPDGFRGYTVGIALPAMPKEQEALILGALLVGFLVLIVVGLLAAFNSIGKYDKNGILTSNRAYLTQRITQGKHTSLEAIIETLSNCEEMKPNWLGEACAEHAPGIVYMCVDICLNIMKAGWQQADAKLIRSVTRQIQELLRAIPKIVQHRSDEKHPGKPQLAVSLIGKDYYTTSDIFTIKAALRGLTKSYISSKTFPVLKHNEWNLTLTFNQQLVGFRQVTEDKEELEVAFQFMPEMFQEKAQVRFELELTAFADSYPVELQEKVVVNCKLPQKAEDHEESAKESNQGSEDSEEEAATRRVRGKQSGKQAESDSEEELQKEPTREQKGKASKKGDAKGGARETKQQSKDQSKQRLQQTKKRKQD